ncbi:MAG: PAAR domain-containing protein, partial [Herminiimonas sp.]|nr:PAAR domain-containing protein [Herminiimonas sp.]
MDAQAAARMGDEIAHGFGLAAMVAGAVAGAIVGAAIVAATVATGGVAAVIIAGCVAGGGLSMFQLVKGLTTIFNLQEPASGMLITGSSNVFVNNRAAIRASVDQATCSGFPFNHPPLPLPVLVADGSATVFVNNLPMSRLQSKIVCGAHIKSGSPDTFVGGPNTTMAFVFDLEGWLHTGLEILGVGAVIGAGVIAAAAGAAALAGFVAITGGAMLAFEGLGHLGNAIGPGYGDLLQGVAGLGLLFAGPRLAK